MNLNFEINSVENFETNLSVAYNVLEDTEIERRFARSRYKFGMNTAFGVGCHGYISEELEHAINTILTKFNYKQIDMFSTYLFIDKYKQIYPHTDNENFNNKMFAAVIYLNERETVVSGTNVYNVLNKDISKSIQDNIITSVEIKGEVNKMVLYDGGRLHSAATGYGDKLDDIRLIKALFIDCEPLLSNNNNNNHLQQCYDSHMEYKLFVLDNYYLNVDKVYRFFYKKNAYMNMKERNKRDEIEFKYNNLLENGYVNDNIQNKVAVFEQILSKEITSITSCFSYINNSLIFEEREENIWYGLIFINDIFNRNKLIIDCKNNNKDILHANKNRLILFNSVFKSKLEVFDYLFIEVIKIKIK